MTQIEFYKYQATGNDFILIDDREAQLNLTASQIDKLCNRKFGIGSDGLILIRNHPEYDFEMIFYNPDGSQSLCGNGSRCAVSFAKHLGLMNSTTRFLAYDGEHEATILDTGAVSLKMSNVQTVNTVPDGMLIDTGSPHLLKYVDNIEGYNVYDEGRAIRNNASFKQAGVNVNFVEVKGKSEIFVRTYERGVENETLSCGTGVTAAALSASTKGLDSPITVETKGGTLQVDFVRESNNQYSKIYLQGPAELVFKGTFEMTS